MKVNKVVPLASREANLKRRVRAHLKGLGFRKAKDGTLVPPAWDKVSYRAIHGHQRAEKLEKNREWLKGKVESLSHYFASGVDVDVYRIRPRLELVAKETWQSDLFRLAGLYWQIPISEGYGRRLRFLICDDSNQKLIGLLALGDAVFTLRARDAFVRWDH